MSKPSIRADSINAIVEPSDYDRLESRPYSDDYVFRIDPPPLAWPTIIGMNLLIVAFCYGFHWVAKHYIAEPGIVFLYIGPIGIGVWTCLIITAVFCFSSSGVPWLVYDKATGSVKLPRKKLNFDRKEVVRIEYIATRHYYSPIDRESYSVPRKSWRLYLVTCRNGVEKHWSLMHNYLFVNKPLDRILMSLVHETDLPVVQVHNYQDQQLRETLTQSPYTCGMPVDEPSVTMPQPAAVYAKPSSIVQTELRYRQMAKARNRVSNRVLIGLFSTGWVGISILLFCGTWVYETNLERRTALIDCGEAKPQTVWVDAMHREHTNDSRECRISLRTSQKGKMLSRSDVNVDDLTVGSPLTAYRFDDEFGDGYLVPRFDCKGIHVSPWLFLMAGTGPLLVAGSVFLVKKLRLAPNRDSMMEHAYRDNNSLHEHQPNEVDAFLDRM